MKKELSHAVSPRLVIVLGFPHEHYCHCGALLSTEKDSDGMVWSTCVLVLLTIGHIEMVCAAGDICSTCTQLIQGEVLGRFGSCAMTHAIRGCVVGGEPADDLFAPITCTNCGCTVGGYYTDEARMAHGCLSAARFALYISNKIGYDSEISYDSEGF